MSSYRKWWTMAFAGWLCAGVAGCDSKTIVEVVPVSEVLVSPSSITLSAGTTQQLSATLKGAGGHNLGGRTVTWSSNNSGVAVVSESGLVTGVGAGTATITATSEGRSGSASVTLPTQRLTVAKAGAGSGVVTSSPAGIDCGTTCGADFSAGVVVTLTATASSGSTFAGWSGACTGATSTCQVTMTQARTVTATFNLQVHALTVTKAGAGSGVVTSSPAGIDCGTACEAGYASGTVVTLTATASSGSTFAGWSGACSGLAVTCQVTMSAARSVMATFNPYTPRAVQDHGFTEVYPNTAYYAWSYSDERATRFEIDYRVDGAAWASVEFPASTRAVVASDLPNGFFLEFRIRACNLWGCSANSTIAAASGPLTPSVTKVAVPSSQSSLSGAWLSTTYYRVYVPPSAGLTELTIKTFGGTGDVDLYVRQGRVPVLSTELWDCRSDEFGNADSCSFTNPQSGDYYILLHGYEAYSGVTLEITAAAGGAAALESPQEGVRVQGPRITRIPG